MSEKEHQCKTISLQNRRKHRSLTINRVNDEWIFAYKVGRYAADPAEAHLVEPDRISFACHLTINFCPYCGDNLSGEIGLSMPTSTYQVDKNFERVHVCTSLERYNQTKAGLDSSEDQNGVWQVVGQPNSIRGYCEWRLDRYSLSVEQNQSDHETGQSDILCFEYGFAILFCPFCGIVFDEEEPPRRDRVNQPV